MSHVHEAGEFPAPTEPVRLLRCEEGQDFTLRFLETREGGMFTHYAGRSIRCWGIGNCEPCRKKLRRLWKGYYAVEVYRNADRAWYPSVLEATEHLELCFRGRNLLGEVWKIWRLPKEGKKPMPIEGAYLRTLPADLLRDPFPVEVVLQWLYGPGSYSLTDKNPLPPKLYLAPTRDVAKPAEAKPAEAKPANGKPANGKPAEAKPANGKPAEAKPANGKPASDHWRRLRAGIGRMDTDQTADR